MQYFYRSNCNLYSANLMDYCKLIEVQRHKALEFCLEQWFDLMLGDFNKDKTFQFQLFKFAVLKEDFTPSNLHKLSLIIKYSCWKCYLNFFGQSTFLYFNLTEFILQPFTCFNRNIKTTKFIILDFILLILCTYFIQVQLQKPIKTSLKKNKINKMGQQQSKKLSVHSSESSLRCKKKLQIQNWIVLETPQIANDLQTIKYQILKNQITSQVAQVYTVHFYEKEAYLTYIQEFDYWRSIDRPNIITSKYLVIDKDADLVDDCCGSYYIVKLFVQNAAVTLSQIKDIPHAESLYILLSCLIGYEHLFQIFDYFPIKEEMIIINNEGVVKVWMNPDFSRNRPLALTDVAHQSSFIVSSPRTQSLQPAFGRISKFIKQLIELIHNNTDYSKSQQTFKRYVQKKCSHKNLNFRNCKKLLLNFAEQLQIDIPNSLVSILDILFQKTENASISHQNIVGDNDHILYGKNYRNQYLLGEQNEDLSSVNKNPYSPKQNQMQMQREAAQLQSFSHYQKKSSDLGSQIQMPKTNIKYETSSPKYTSSPPKSRTNQNSLQSGSQQFNDFHLESHNYANQMPKMSFSYVNQDIHQFGERQNNQQIIQGQNPYYSLLQKQKLQKQSTIRQQAQQQSFFTSYKNSKFQTARDAKRGSIHLKTKNFKNNSGHQKALSSQQEIQHAQAKDIIAGQRYSKQQIYQTKNVQKGKIQKREENESKKSKKSITFYTPTQVRQLDDQIAQDLQQMITLIKV